MNEHTSIARDARSAAEWIAAALSSSGYVMDFSITSLKEIDRFFDEHAPNGKTKAGWPAFRNFGNRMFSIGAYVGRSSAGGPVHDGKAMTVIRMRKSGHYGPASFFRSARARRRNDRFP